MELLRDPLRCGPAADLSLAMGDVPGLCVGSFRIVAPPPQRTTNIELERTRGGSLEDEERSKMRYVMGNAKPRLIKILNASGT